MFNEDWASSFQGWNPEIWYWKGQMKFSLDIRASGFIKDSWICSLEIFLLNLSLYINFHVVTYTNLPLYVYFTSVCNIIYEFFFCFLQHKELDHLSYKKVGRSTFVGDLTSSFELFHKFLNKFSLAFKCISATHTHYLLQYII